MRAILTYHSIDDSASAISLSREQFGRHLEWLASNRVRVVALTELLELPDEASAVALTFDDAFLNFSSEAWPELKRYGFPATLFVVSDRVGGSNQWGTRGFPHPARLPLLDWGDLRMLAAEGVAMGAHTRTHADLRVLQGNDLDEEVVTCASIIEDRVGRSVDTFAFPYGIVTPDALARIRDRYRYACTTEFRTLRGGEDRHLLPRLDAYYFRSRHSLLPWPSPALRSYLGARAVLRRFRGLVKP
jgi:peptidoglycan/xylan/chitin deacetylase (PgdA/CDA1 family)